MDWIRTLALVFWFVAPLGVLWLFLRQQRSRSKTVQAHAQSFGLNYKALSGGTSAGARLLQQMMVLPCTIHSVVELRAFEPFQGDEYGEISNLVSGTWNGIRIICFDHLPRHQTGHAFAGKGYVALQLPLAVPMTKVHRADAMGRLVRLLDRGAYKTGSAEFDEVFRLDTTDPNFAHLLLDDRLRYEMLSSPTASWQFGPMYVVAGLKEALTPDVLDRALMDFDRVLSAVPQHVYAAYGFAAKS